MKSAFLSLSSALFVGVALTLSSALPAAAEPEYPMEGTVKVEKPRQLKNVIRVLVPHFAVSFVVADKKSAVASTGRNKPFARKASSTTKAAIAGLSDETMQQITDLAYQDFIQTLKDNGIEVLEEEAGAAHALARQTKMDMTKFLDGPAKNYSVYRKFYNNNIEDRTFSPSGTQLIAPRIGNAVVPHMYGASARELEVPVLVVDYVVTFGHISADAKEYYGIAGVGNAAASTNFAPGLQVMWSSDIKVYHTEKKTGRLMIEKNAWTAKAFASAESNTWSGGSRVERNIVLNVDNDLYQAAAMDVIGRASDTLVSTLVSQ